MMDDHIFHLLIPLIQLTDHSHAVHSQLRRIDISPGTSILHEGSHSTRSEEDICGVWPKVSFRQVATC